MNNQLGAHELLELKEVLDKIKSGIQIMEMYRPFVSEGELERILERQLHFSKTEYNTFVNNLGLITETPNYYHAPSNVYPTYGMSNVDSMYPDGVIKDCDIASALLGLHKSTASIKLHATLECADPEMREMIMQSVENCVNLAFEIWAYMNDKGYYPVPKLQDDESHKLIHSYDVMTKR